MQHLIVYSSSKCSPDTFTYVIVSSRHFNNPNPNPNHNFIATDNISYLITYPEVPSFVRRTEFFYRVPRIIIKSVNITVFPHLYKFKILLLLKTLRKNCSIQQTLYTEVYYIKFICKYSYCDWILITPTYNRRCSIIGSLYEGKKKKKLHILECMNHPSGTLDCCQEWRTYFL